MQKYKKIQKYKQVELHFVLSGLSTSVWRTDQDMHE